MELLETQDPEKKKLIESSDRHKRALEKEVGELTQKTDRLLTNALIIGGSLALTFFVISSLSKKRKKKKIKLARATAATAGELANPVKAEEEEEEEGPSLFNKVGTKIMDQAMLMLLDIAKDKLMEYIESRKKTDEHS